MSYQLKKGAIIAAVVLLVAEGVARLARPEPPPEPAGPHALKLDGDLLWVVERGEQEMHATKVNINSLGLRGPELQSPKERDRLMTVGDSSVFGFGVQGDQVMGAVASRVLGLESVNAAMSGYSTEQALAVMDRVAERVVPDILVIAALWSDNNFDGFVDRELREELRQRDGGRALSFLRDNVVLLSLLRPPPPPRTVGFGSSAQSPELGRRRVPLQDYVANLDELARRATDLGGAPLFVILANDQDVRGAAGPHQWDPYRHAMRDAAARWGCPVVDMSTQVQGDGSYLLDQMHPTTRGHRRIGEAIATAVQGTGWPAEPLCGPALETGVVHWDPWQQAPPQGAELTGWPRFTGVLWTDRDDAERATVVAEGSWGRREQTLPARSAFGFEVPDGEVQLSVVVEYRDGSRATVDFGLFEAPVYALRLDLDEARTF